VRVLDTAKLMREILQVCNSDHLSATLSNRQVVAKIDVEGMDENIIQYLKISGILCRIDYVYVEHMHSDKIKSLNAELSHQGCTTLIEYMDDEDYHNSDFPLSP